MSIIRIQKNIENPFVRIPRTVAQNRELTWEARGLLEYLLSKPDGWEIRNNDLINQSPAGGSVVKRIIKELITHGYVHRVKVSEGRGKIKTVSTVFEDPSFNRHFTSVQFSTDESYTDVNYTGVKPAPIETRDSEKQESLKTTDSSTDEDFSNISIIWQSNFGFLSPIVADNLKAALKEHPPDWILEAMKRAIEQNVRKWSYVAGILRNFEADGGPQHNGTGKPKGMKVLK